MCVGELELLRVVYAAMYECFCVFVCVLLVCVGAVASRGWALLRRFCVACVLLMSTADLRLDP